MQEIPRLYCVIIKRAKLQQKGRDSSKPEKSKNNKVITHSYGKNKPPVQPVVLILSYIFSTANHIVCLNAERIVWVNTNDYADVEIGLTLISAANSL